MGDVTNSAYEEVASLEQMAEKISAVTPLTAGLDVPDYNTTATGAALISEQGNTRFSFKVRIAELTGLRRLFRQYGSLIQQFTPEDFQLRIIGPDGRVDFQPIIAPQTDAQGNPVMDEMGNPVMVNPLEGAFDYDIEAESSTQTETVRKQQSLSLLQTLAALTKIDPMTGQVVPVLNVDALAEDVLRAFDKKDIDRYMRPEQQMPMEQQTGGQMPTGALPPELAGLAPGNGRVAG
jgi:hypothetical protein